MSSHKLVYFCLVILGIAQRAWSGELVLEVLPDDAASTSAAVVVDPSAHLVLTGQIVAGPGDRGIVEQTREVLDRLEATLKEVGSGLNRLVKVDFYVASGDDLPAVRGELARRLAGQSRPAVSFVVTALSVEGARVALDATAVTPQRSSRGPSIAILPAGRTVYVSGQAVADTDLAAATRKTLEGLGDTLAHLGLEKRRVVRLKAFLQPMASSRVVGKEVAAYFGADFVPPLSFVEWRSSPNQPIEIELIAAAGPAGNDGPSVDYLTPPALKPSPVFSRVARVNHGPTIFISDLYGAPDATGPAQVESIFASLTKTLDAAGSDLLHLVKATYYVSDDAPSRALNELRPRYYDPARPPAASKAAVVGVGAEGRSVSLDMIAVPR